MKDLTDEELHSQVWDTVCKLNREILELAERGCDVNVQVKGIDTDLQSPKTKPKIVVRVTRLVGYTNTRPEGQLVPFRPTLVNETAP